MGKNRYYCRYKGIVYNMSKLQEVLDSTERQSMDIIYTLVDEYGLEPLDAWVFEDVLKFRNYDIPADYDQALKEMQDYNQERIKAKQVSCPYCHSTDVEERSFAPFVWSAPEKFWYCNKCRCEFGHHY